MHLVQDRIFICLSQYCSVLLTDYSYHVFIAGLPPLVFRRILEILTYLATNHSAVAKMLFHFDQSIPDSSSSSVVHINGKGKEKVIEGEPSPKPSGTQAGDIPLVLFLKLLNRPLFLRSTAHLEQVMGLIQVVVDTAALKLECQTQSEKTKANTQNLSVNEAEKDPPLVELDSNQQDKHADLNPCHSDGKKNVDMYNIFLQLPQSDLRNLCSLLGCEGYFSTLSYFCFLFVYANHEYVILKNCLNIVLPVN